MQANDYICISAGLLAVAVGAALPRSSNVMRRATGAFCAQPPADPYERQFGGNFQDICDDLAATCQNYQGVSLVPDYSTPGHGGETIYYCKPAA